MNISIRSWISPINVCIQQHREYVSNIMDISFAYCNEGKLCLEQKKRDISKCDFLPENWSRDNLLCQEDDKEYMFHQLLSQ